MSVYGRYVVGLFLSVWVQDCWSAVGYNSSSVLMIGFQSVWCRLCIGLKSGDSIPNLTRDDLDMKPTAFTVSSATLSMADSWPIHCKFCGFCRFLVGLASVTGVWRVNNFSRHGKMVQPGVCLQQGVCLLSSVCHIAFIESKRPSCRLLHGL